MELPINLKFLSTLTSPNHLYSLFASNSVERIKIDYLGLTFIEYLLCTGDEEFIINKTNMLFLILHITNPLAQAWETSY